jgi:hypothetical protein
MSHPARSRSRRANRFYEPIPHDERSAWK